MREIFFKCVYEEKPLNFFLYNIIIKATKKASVTLLKSQIKYDMKSEWMNEEKNVW